MKHRTPEWVHQMDLERVVPLLAITGVHGASVQVHARYRCGCGAPKCRTVHSVMSASGPLGEFQGTATYVPAPEDTEGEEWKGSR